jgi:alpha-L-fucosidase
VPGIHQNYLTPEQHIPDKGLPYPWETCMTMATSWSYVPNDQYKSANELIEKLVDIVSKGGNFLLNIGPSPTGEFDSAAYNRLSAIGKWMKVNSEAIYATRMHDVYNEGDHIRFAKKKDNSAKFIYLFEFPDGSVTLSKMKFTRNTRVTMLGSTKTLTWKQTAKGVEITVPLSLRKVTNHVWVLKAEE